MPDRGFLFASALVSIVWCASCAACSGGGGMDGADSREASRLPNTVRIACWNAQTFFDAVDDGTEFREFRGSASAWSESRYVERLSRLAEALVLAGEVSGAGRGRVPDIAVLCEIENERVLSDLWNRLPRSGGFTDAVFVPPGKGLAFGTGILARAAPVGVTAHTIDHPTESVRPMIEAEFGFKDEGLVIFACHWKSKAGGDGGSSVRSAQERLLVDRIGRLARERPGTPFVACGDFNQQPAEFGPLRSYPNAWSRWTSGEWPGSTGIPAGSYWYRENWEAIDHFFFSPSLGDGEGDEVTRFAPVAEPPLVDVDGLPARYELYSGRGYSDHLPLTLTIN